MNFWINDKGDYRKAPATPGLLKRVRRCKTKWKGHRHKGLINQLLVSGCNCMTSMVNFYLHMFIMLKFLLFQLILLLVSLSSLMFSSTRPSGPSWSSSRHVSVSAYLFVPSSAFLSRPLISPQITWSDPGLSLVNPPPLLNLFFFFIKKLINKKYKIK